MKPEQISIKDFIYELPVENIAQYPLTERHASKLLVYKDQEIKEDIYLNIDHYLPSGSMLFFNDTKVLQARMLFQNAKGDKIEIFCLEPSHGKDIAVSMASTGFAEWKCMVGRAAKWKEQFVHFSKDLISIQAEIINRASDSFTIQFKWQPEQLSFAEVLHKAGVMPIPPYLKRATEEIDIHRYQTIYAKEEGSVAAPTAGLHFTDTIFKKLLSKNIHPSYLTLHVGAGTFKPVKAPVMAEHEMHSEFIDIKKTTIEEIIFAIEKPKVVVGTTSLRTIETIYWLGVKLFHNPDIDVNELQLNQWEPYKLEEAEITSAQALNALAEWMAEKEIDRLVCKTSLLIVPGYKFRLVDALITNFHQPESTLILLVAALLGDQWRKVYDYALQNQFRFLSYGDGSLLFVNKKH